MGKDWKLYARHVADCIVKIEIICQRGSLSEDFVLYDAALRNLQTLAESTMHFPDHIKATYAHINWKGISGFRNILVHDYLGNIDPETVTKIITENLPGLKTAIAEMCKAR